MNKFIQTFLAFLTVTLLAPIVYAATMTVKIEAPKSPTTLTDLKINFVVLDYASDGSITAKCYFNKDGGAVAQFGGDIAIPAGGGSSNCTTTSSQVSGNGTYKFYVTATNNAGTENSPEVTVNYSDSRPGTPTNYGKSRANVCDYKINFRTADDGGKTVKVEVYRSSNTSFTADAGTRVDTIAIGSNSDGSSVTTPPNCTTNYFFAVRAFDSAGNGSGLVGDSVTVTTTTTTTTAPSAGSGQAGAIPAGTGGNILGVDTSQGATGASGAILGEEATGTPQPKADQPLAGTPSTDKLFGLGAAAVAAILFVTWLLKRKK